MPHAKYIDVSDAGHMVAGIKTTSQQGRDRVPDRYQDNRAGRLGKLRFYGAARWMPDHVRHDGSPLHETRRWVA